MAGRLCKTGKGVRCHVYIQGCTHATSSPLVEKRQHWYYSSGADVSGFVQELQDVCFYTEPEPELATAAEYTYRLQCDSAEHSNRI